MSASEDKAVKFFTYPEFAVVEASENTFERSNMILNWYHEHRLPVTPVNRNEGTISIPSSPSPLMARPSVGVLPAPWDTALSVVTPPHKTRQMLEEASSMGVPAVWLEQESLDMEVLSWLSEEERFQVCVLGDGGSGGHVWSVLFDGARMLQQANR